MHFSYSTAAAFLIASPAWAAPSFEKAPRDARYPTLSIRNESQTWMNWTTYKGNGVNLGGWMIQEKGIDLEWWETYSTAADEWNFCLELGDKCGPIMEERYATFITTADIDKLAAAGIDTLRIPTTYAAWIEFPGSELYHGNQQGYLRNITNYAIETYNMHIILGMHDLPGGINYLDIGEAVGHIAWFNSTVNLEYSWQAIDSILAFMISSNHLNSFTISALNEPCDNVTGIFTTTGLTDNGLAWINKYVYGILDRVAEVDARIPVMLQDAYRGAEAWFPYYEEGTNIVFDTHIYFFEVPGANVTTVLPEVCERAKTAVGSQKFPVWIGEWSLQTTLNNTFADRQILFDTQRYAWTMYAAGSSFWTAKHPGNGTVDGEGDLSDYWDYLKLIDAGVITNSTDVVYC